MTPDTHVKLEKVRKYSASLRGVFKLLFALVAIAGVVGLLVIALSSFEETSISFGDLVLRGDEVTASVRMAGAIGLLIGRGVALKLLYHLVKLFDLYANGYIFTADNVAQIRQIGISVFLFTAGWLYSLVMRAILGGADALPADAGEISSINVGSSGVFGFVLTGVIIIIVSWIMDVGRELREEQDLTV